MRVWDLTYTLLYIKQINNKDLPYNTGNYSKYFIVAYNGKESEKIHTHIYVHVLCLVTQLCPTFCDPTDYSLPGPSVREDSPGKNAGVSSHALLQGIFATQVFRIAGGFFTN